VVKVKWSILENPGDRLCFVTVMD